MWICFKHKWINDGLIINNLENWIWFSYQMGYKEFFLLNPDFFEIPEVCQFFERYDLGKYWITDTMKYSAFPKEIFDLFWIEYEVQYQFQDLNYNWFYPNYPQNLKTYYNQFQLEYIIHDYIELHKNDNWFNEYNSNWTNEEFINWLDELGLLISFWNESLIIWNNQNKFKKEPDYSLELGINLDTNYYNYTTEKLFNKDLYWSKENFLNLQSYFLLNNNQKWILFTFKDNKFI